MSDYFTRRAALLSGKALIALPPALGRATLHQRPHADLACQVMRPIIQGLSPRHPGPADPPR